MEQEWIDESHGITRCYPLAGKIPETKQEDGNISGRNLHSNIEKLADGRKRRERERRIQLAGKRHLLRSLLNAVFYIRLIPSGFTRERSANSNSSSFLLSRNFKFTVFRVKILLTHDETPSSRSLAWPVNIREYLLSLSPCLSNGGKSILCVVENIFATRLSFRVHDYATRIGSLNRHNR